MGLNMGIPFNMASLAITPQLLSLMAETDAYNDVRRALGTLAPDKMSALRRENRNSITTENRKNHRIRQKQNRSINGMTLEGFG